MDQSPGFAIDPEIMFSDHKGQYRKGMESHQRKLAEHTHFLDHFLDEQEKVLLIAKCCSPMGQIEQLLTGWIIFYLKRALLVIGVKPFWSKAFPPVRYVIWDSRKKQRAGSSLYSTREEDTSTPAILCLA